MQKYEVGKKIFPATNDDTIRCQADDAGLSLVISYNKPTAAEKRDLKKTPQIEVVTVNDIIFLLMRFGERSWMDAPFNKEFSTLSKPIEIPDDKTKGLSLHIMIVDSSTGVLLHQKLIGIEHNLSSRIAKAINNQPHIPNYNKALNNVYNQYSTIQLVQIAKEQTNEK